MLNIFSLFILKDAKYDLYFFRSHVQIMSKILLYITNHKLNFLKKPKLLYEYFKNELIFYMKKNQCIRLKNLLEKIFMSIEKIYRLYSRNFFTFIINFLTMFLEKGYYYISLLTLSSFDSYDEKKIIHFFLTCIDHFKINTKLVFISINTNIEKGILIQYKNYIIDLSLKKLTHILQNAINLNKIGEIAHG